MLNRKIGPTIKSIDSITLNTPRIHTLSGGVPLYEINMGDQEITKLEVVFEAGRPYEFEPLTSRATLHLLKEGTENRKGAEIAEELDFFGANISISDFLDYSSISLFSLNKHFEKTLSIFSDIILNPTFPDDELETYKNRRIQKLKIDLNRPEIIGYRTFTEAMYGSQHPYGYNSNEELYRKIDRLSIIQHYREHYITGKCKIFISGKVEKKMIELIDNTLVSKLKPGEPDPVFLTTEWIEPHKIRVKHLAFDMQNSIHIGRRLFNRSHSDYPGMYCLTTLLGGYFSSRLMSNIREDKGYTYSIYSSLDTALHDGYFYVATEVASDNREKTIKEIYNELERLQTKLINQKELKLVQNYLSGHFLTMVDSPFNVAEVIKTYALENLDPIGFLDFSDKVLHIKADNLLELSKKYLSMKDMWQVIV